MTVNKISREEFTAWAAETTVEYASESIRIEEATGHGKGFKPNSKRLRFLVKLGGGYRVEFGGMVIYEGDDFDQAVSTYHRAPMAAERLSKVMPNASL